MIDWSNFFVTHVGEPCDRQCARDDIGVDCLSVFVPVILGSCVSAIMDAWVLQAEVNR
jgi:hypothetical protein